MSAAHVHLVLVHFPIVGTIIGVAILTLGFITKKDSINAVALALFVAMALVTIPVFLSGHEAEHQVEKLPGVTRGYIHQHEEMAHKAIWVMGALGVLSALTLIAMWKDLSFKKPLLIAVCVGSLATAGVFIYLGYLGGQIRHTEIRSGTPPAEPPAWQGDHD